MCCCHGWITPLGELIATLSKIPGGEALETYAGDLVAQLQADPTTREGLAQLGIEPEGAAAAWFSADLQEGSPVIALPAMDEGVLVQRLAALAQRAGAVGTPQQTSDGCREFRTASGDVVLATAVRDGFVLLARNVGQLRSTPASSSPVNWSELRALQKDLGDEQDLLVFAQPSMVSGIALPSPLLLGARLGAHGLHVRAVLQASPALAAVVSELGTKATFEALPDSAVITLQLAGPPAALGRILADRLPREIVGTLSAAGIDLQKDVLENLRSGISIALSLARAPDFSRATSIDPRVANPFREVRLVALARVVDLEKAKMTLRQLATLGKQWGTTYSQREMGGRVVLVASYALGETVSLALVDKTLVVTGGEGEMAAAFDRLRSDPLATEADGPLIRLRFRPAMLVAQVRAIPEMSFGGLAGLTLRSLLSRVLDPLTHFGDLVLELSADQNAGVLLGDFDLPVR